MPIPNTQTLLLPVLKVLRDGAEHDVEEIRQRITDQFDVTASELAQKQKSGVSVFANYVAWALSYLNRGHTRAIARVRKGVYRITEHGAAILKRNPSELTPGDL